MTKKPPVVLQIGKNGLTDNFFLYMIPMFKDRENVKITVLKSAGHTKQKVESLANEVVSRLKREYSGKDFTFRIVGFAIFLKKWRKIKKI